LNNLSKNPFAEAVLARISLPTNALVVDLACGLGRPGLDIAKRHPGVSVLGVDIAKDIIEQAREIASADGLTNIELKVMDMEDLAIANSSIDVVVSLFGLLQVGDLERTIGEMARVLKNDGQFSIAAYEDIQQHTLMAAAIPVLSPYASSDLTPTYNSAAPGGYEKCLLAAGLRVAEAELFHCTISFASFEMVWQMLSSPQMFGRLFAALSEPDLSSVKIEMQAALASFENSQGNNYTFPMSCRLLWGRR